MKNRIYILLLIIFFLPLIGHSYDNFFFQTNIGANSPFNYPTLSNYYSKGVILGSGIGYIINNNLALVGKISYTYFQFREFYPTIIPFFIQEEYTWYSPDLVRGIKIEKTYLLELSVNLIASQFKTNGRVQPFISLGIGYLIQRIGNIEVTLMDFINSNGKYNLKLPGEFDDFSLNLGAGFEVRVPKRINFFIEGRLLFKGNLLTNSNSAYVYVPVELGIRF
jgi:hypothetical protein